MRFFGDGVKKLFEFVMFANAPADKNLNDLLTVNVSETCAIPVVSQYGPGSDACSIKIAMPHPPVVEKYYAETSPLWIELIALSLCSYFITNVMISKNNHQLGNKTRRDLLRGMLPIFSIDSGGHQFIAHTYYCQRATQCHSVRKKTHGSGRLKADGAKIEAVPYGATSEEKIAYFSPATPLNVKNKGSLICNRPESENTNRMFFHKFCEVVSNNMFKQAVCPVTDPADVARVTG